MTVLHQSLQAAIQTLHQNGTRIGVVVIHVTESAKATNIKAPGQKAILAQCNALGLPAWFVQMDVFGGAESQQDLLALVDPLRRRELLNKGNNVFNGSTLAADLAREEITTLVVMGEELRSCIRMSITAIDSDHQGPAAIQLGFTVLTSPLLLRAGAAHDQTWPAEISALAIGEEKLSWYTQL
jgi:nicotinamidase-related amidase